MKFAAVFYLFVVQFVDLFCSAFDILFWVCCSFVCMFDSLCVHTSSLTYAECAVNRRKCVFVSDSAFIYPAM